MSYLTPYLNKTSLIGKKKEKGIDKESRLGKNTKKQIKDSMLKVGQFSIEGLGSKKLRKI
jgi:hypothetical protein